ncbi:MAG: LysM peptidoglycan-binding domain-containing protein, partial [Clostridia bacterium]|nr:LysM peptidoglycan-binding domain-containing protein [Clostridia bacterium]
PSGQYVGQSRAEFAGTCMHRVLYTDAQGQVWGATVPSDFELAVPLSGADPATVKCHAYHTVESNSCRLGGPRRISVRAVVASRVHLFAPCTDLPQTDFSGEGCERLQKSVAARCVYPFSSERVHFSETVKAESADELRVLCAEGAVLVREARGEGEDALCSGEVYLKALCAGKDGAPFPVCAKLPFEEKMQGVLPCEGLSLCVCAYVTDVEATLSTDAEGAALVTFDASVVFDGLAEKNETINAVCDLFSQSSPVEVSYTELPLQKSMGIMMANFTLDGSESCEACDSVGAFSVADTAVCARLLSLSYEGERVFAEGEAQVSMLLSMPAEQGEGMTLWQAANFKTPIKMELSMPNPLPNGVRLEGELVVATAKGRVDRERLCCDFEVRLCVHAAAEAPVRMVCAYTADAAHPFEEGRSEIISAYLKEGDTLWEIAKRYHASPEQIVTTNDLPPQALAEPDAAYTLDGYTRLLIEK